MDYTSNPFHTLYGSLTSHCHIGDYQLLTVTEEAKTKGWFDCLTTDGEVVKARHTGKGTKILHENDDKTKGIISHQYDVYSRRKEGANKKQEMMDSFLDSFVEDRNGTLYKVKFTKSRRGNTYTIHSTDEVVVLDGYGDDTTKATEMKKKKKKVVVKKEKKESGGDDVMETEKSAGGEGKVAAVSSSKSEADSMPPAGLDLLAEAVESREKSKDYDSDATIALVSSSSSEETEEEKQAAAGLDALLSGKNGKKNRRKRQEVEAVPVAEDKGGKAEECILDESIKQDVNAFIETCKKGRSALIDKATTSIQDDQLHDKKEKLEKDLEATKIDMALVKSEVFKQYGERTLLDTTQQLKEVDTQLDAEREQIRNKKESIQAVILKELGGNEDEREVAAKPLKKRKIESEKVVDGILDENTKQDVNAYIETVKQGRSVLFDKATSGMMNSNLLDKKEKLEQECSSLKLDLSLVTSERFKQYGEQKLLDANRELKEVEIELLAEDEKMQGTKQAVQAIIMKALGEDDATH